MLNLLRDKKNGQVAPFMVLVMAVLILAIAATMIIGETGFTRLRMANMADAALISGVSAFCRGLNQIPPLHNRMFLNWLALQTALAVGSPYTNKMQAYAAAFAFTAIATEQNFELLSAAWDLVKTMPRELRSSVYDTVFGGALIDEPKPFRDTSTPGHLSDGDPGWEKRNERPDTCEEKNLIGWGEVGRDAQGRINFVNFPKYLYRDSHFICQYRSLKFRDNEWFKKDSLAYFFDKDQKMSKDHPGVLKTTFVPGQSEKDPAVSNYEAYLALQLSDFPDEVNVYPYPALAFFTYFLWFCTPLHGCFIYGVAPGFTLLPFAGIAWVDFRSNFGMTVYKRIPFTRIPFFNRAVDLQHKNRVNIRGNIWSGYEFSLE